MVTLLRVYVVRHGETAANKDGTIQGQLDTELNEEGLRQAALLAERMKTVPIHVAFTSDLQRAKKTAEIVLNHHPGVELQQRKALRERFLGTLQGTNLPPLVRRMALGNDPTVETGERVSSRMLAWWDEDIIQLAQRRLDQDREALFDEGKEAAGTPTNVLVASHGGSIHSLFTAARSEGLFEFAPRVTLTRCWNTSVSVVEVDESLVGTVTEYADVSHLLGTKVVRTNVG